MSKIDVTECRYYSCGVCYAEPKYFGVVKGYDKCNKHEDCYYKKFQQLKAENEFKESQINDWIKQYKLAHQKYMKLQTENEKLKEENQEMYKMGCENFVAIEQAKRLYKLNKCLDEIEEICDKELCKGEIKDLDMYCAMENIIHKVKEVKGE